MTAKDFIKLIDDFDIDAFNDIDGLDPDYGEKTQHHNFMLDEAAAILAEGGGDVKKLQRAYTLGYMKAKGIYAYEELTEMPEYEVDIVAKSKKG